MTKAQEIAERLGVSEAKVRTVLAHPEQVGSLMRQQSLSEEAAVFSLLADQEVLREINDILIGPEPAASEGTHRNLTRGWPGWLENK